MKPPSLWIIMIFSGIATFIAALTSSLNGEWFSPKALLYFGIIFPGLVALLYFGFKAGRFQLKKAQDSEASALKDAADVRAALDAHSIVAITNSAGKITYINDKFCEISKYPREELIGQDHRIINSSYHPKSFFADLWKTIGQGKIWKGAIRNRAKDGTYYWVQTTIFPILDAAGKPRQYIAIRTDVTREKETEVRLTQLADELTAKNKELETTVYVISHDLRSPLLNIQGFGAELIRKSKELKEKIAKGNTEEVNTLLDKDIPHALRFIEAGISKMDGLLNGFLRFSRLGRVVLHLETLKMNALLSTCIQALNFQTQQAGATVQVEPLPDCIGDMTLVGQIFTNLIDNALKYRHPSRPCIVKVSGEVQGSEVIYTVEDNGIGIAKDHQPKVFELFHRLNPKQSEGEGLGLAIAQRIVERQRGRIWLDSAVEKGTRFYIALPTSSF